MIGLEANNIEASFKEERETLHEIDVARQQNELEIKEREVAIMEIG